MSNNNSNSFGWLSVVVSIYFIIRGVIYISNGTLIWGGIMTVIGIAGLIWKLVDMNKSK